MENRKKLLLQWLGAVLGIGLLCGGASYFAGWKTAPAKKEAARTEGTPLPIVMYHNVLPDGEKGELGEYVIAASELEGDLSYLRDCGYETVTASEVFDAVRGVGTLPEKPVMLTFDDGFETMEQTVLPLLSKYGAKAVAALVGEYTDLYSGDVPKALSYSHLSWDQAGILADSGLCEIANHSYSMHGLDARQGMRRMPGESEGDYRRALADDLLLMQEKCRDHLGKEPRALCYPYGFYTEESEEAARELGFSLTMTCEQGVNFLTKDKDCLYGLRRNNRPHGADREEFFKNLGIAPE